MCFTCGLKVAGCISLGSQTHPAFCIIDVLIKKGTEKPLLFLIPDLIINSFLSVNKSSFAMLISHLWLLWSAVTKVEDNFCWPLKIQEKSFAIFIFLLLYIGETC